MNRDVEEVKEAFPFQVTADLSFVKNPLLRGEKGNVLKG